MVRENMRSPRAELRINRLRKKLQGLVSGFDSRLATGFGFWGISSNGRAVASHATGKGIDAPILHPRLVSWTTEIGKGLVSSVGRAHDS